MKNLYELLQVPKNATDYEIYRAFFNAVRNFENISDNEQKEYINAFIILSDLELRKNYDVMIGFLFLINLHGIFIIILKMVLIFLIFMAIWVAMKNLLNLLKK